MLSEREKRAAKRQRKRQLKKTAREEATKPDSTAPKLNAAAKAAAAAESLKAQDSEVVEASTRSVAEEVFPTKKPTGKRYALAEAVKSKI